MALQNPQNKAADDKIGVLLVNLGTPDGYDKKSMRRYLREFLSDRRVIETSRWIWYPILHGVILNVRPAKSGVVYKSIWNTEKDESPLRTITRAQGEKLSLALADLPDVEVEWGMRYGTPSIAEKLNQLKDAGCGRIVIFPLYPQYSATTSASVSDKSFLALSAMRRMPAIRTVPSYHRDPVYIGALATSIRNHLADLDYEPEKIMAAYHGLPQAYCDRGDPYSEQCFETTQLLREELGMSEDRLITCFQSRFGPQQWLQPYMDKTLEQFGKEGMNGIAVFNPGFVADCVETLEEVAIEGKEIFEKAGGKNFTHIACLNDSTEGMMVIEEITRRELQGWI